MSSRTGGAGGSGGRYKPSPRPGSLGATGPLLSNRGGSLPVVGGYGQTQGVNSGRNSGRAKTAALPGNENDRKRCSFMYFYDHSPYQYSLSIHPNNTPFRPFDGPTLVRHS